MGAARRTTVYLDPQLHRALRLKAAETERTVSELLNQALRQALVEDGDDLAAASDRVAERTRPFEAFVKDLRRRGKL
jgi:hypothetical protein